MKIQAAATRLFVSDMDTCCRFYRDQLELPVIFEDLERGYVEFAISGLRLSLFSRSEMAEIIRTTTKPISANAQDAVAIIFTVTQLDELYHTLHHQGIHFDEPPTRNADFELKIAYCRDPEGNLIGLFEPLM